MFGPVAGSVRWHVVVLFVLTTLFHILFVWQFPFTRHDWKRVDYIWLAFAGVGLVGATSETRRLQAGWTQESVRFQAGVKLALLREEVQSDTSYFCREQWKPAPGDSIIDPVRRDFPRTCTWFRALGAALPDSLGVDLPEELGKGVPAPPPVQAVTAVQDIHDATTLLEGYKQDQHGYQQSAKDREDGPLEIAFKLAGGFLLVFALALRITKVTGELRSEPRDRPEL
jgi:hypothetical protein